MALPLPRLFDATRDTHLLQEMAQIHADCITHDHQMLTFMPPLSVETKMLDYWRMQSDKVTRGDQAIILQFAGETTKELAGYVCLVTPYSETGPFRGIVEKLLVSPHHRRKGVATRLMAALEEVARGKGRLLLLLDTPAARFAEQFYPKLGYVLMGQLPNFGFNPEDGSLMTEKFFYKDLRVSDV